MKKSQQKWESYLRALSEFVNVHGHSNVPSNFVFKDEQQELKLGTWVGYVRSRGRAGKLPDKRKSELEQIPQWSWNARRPGPSGDTQRDVAIIEARASGRRLQSIATEWNLSRQRVHQILRRSNA